MLDSFKVWLSTRLYYLADNMQSGAMRLQGKSVESLSCEDVLNILLSQNESGQKFGRTLIAHKPLFWFHRCIDHRLSYGKLLGGDIRDWADCSAMPGAAITREVIESARLAVLKHKVKVVAVFRHTECAMEKLAAAEDDTNFLGLQEHTRQFGERFRALVLDPVISTAVVDGELIVVLFEEDVHSAQIRILDKVDRQRMTHGY